LRTKSEVISEGYEVKIVMLSIFPCPLNLYVRERKDVQVIRTIVYTRLVVRTAVPSYLYTRLTQTQTLTVTTYMDLPTVLLVTHICAIWH